MPLRVAGKPLAAVLLVSLSLVSLAAGAAGKIDDAAAAARAKEFARAFVEEPFAKLEPMFDDAMRGAFKEGMHADVKKQLAAQLGTAKEFGTPWSEGALAGYRVFRVPVVFEKATIDLRISVAPDGRVGGVFTAPHSEAPKPDAVTEAKAAELVEAEVQIGPAARSLPGTLTLPKGKGPFPVVVLVHGSGPQDRDETIGPNKPFRDLARGLGEKGIATLRYDMRSVARRDEMIALGDAVTVKEEKIDDAAAAIAFVRTRPEIDPAKVYLLGHSLGGTVAPRIAVEAKPLAGMILLAPGATPVHKAIQRQTRYIAGLAGSPSAEEAKKLAEIDAQVAALDRALAGKEPPPKTAFFGAPFGYYKDLASHDAPAETAALAIPVLILHGKRDYNADASDFERFRRALGGKRFACLVEYPEDDHLFRKGAGPSRPEDVMTAAPMDPRVFEQVSAWIRTKECPGAAR